MHRTTRGSGASPLTVCGVPGVDRIDVIDDVTRRLALDRPGAWDVSGPRLHRGGRVVDAQAILTHATPDDPTELTRLATTTVESGPLVIDHGQNGTMLRLLPKPHACEPPILERMLRQIVPDPSTRRMVRERGDVDGALQVATKDIPDLRKVSGVKVTSDPSARGWW